MANLVFVLKMGTVKVTTLEASIAYKNDFIDQRSMARNTLKQQYKTHFSSDNRRAMSSLSAITGANKLFGWLNQLKNKAILSIGFILLLFLQLQYVSATKVYWHRIEDFDDYNFDYDTSNDKIFNDDDETATLLSLSKYLYGTDVIERLVDDDTILFNPILPMKSVQQAKQRRLKFDKPPPPPPTSGGGQSTDDNFHTADDDFSILDVIRPHKSPTISPTVPLSSSEPSLVFWSVNPTLLPTFIIVDPTDPPTPTFHPSTTTPSNTTDPTKAPVKRRPTRRPTRKPARKPTRKPSRRPTAKPRTSRPISSRPPTQSPRSNEPTDRPIRPTVRPSREPTRPTPIPSLIVIRNETSHPSSKPNVRFFPTIPPSKSIEQTILPLADFTIQLRIPLGTPMINVTSIRILLENYFEIEMVYTNLQSIHLHLQGTSSDVVTSGPDNDGVDDSIVTDIVYQNSEARFVGSFKPKLAGLLDEQEFLLHNTGLIQQYIDTSILTSGAKVMGNDNITVVQCFLDGKGDNNSTSSTSQSESVESGKNAAPDSNSTTMENFLQSPVGFWTILVASGAIATLLIILGIVIIKRTKDEYKCTVHEKKDEGNEDDNCSLPEMYITVPNKLEKNCVLEDTESESDFGNADTSTNKNQKKIAEQFHSLLTLSKTGSLSQFDTTNKGSFDDDDDINYAYSFDADEPVHGGNASTTVTKHLSSQQILSLKTKRLETIDDINATPSTTTIGDDDDNHLSPKSSPDQENIRELMIKMKFLDPSSNVVINGDNEGESMSPSPLNSLEIPAAPKPYSSSAAYFRQQQQPTTSKYKSSSQQKKHQQIQQKNLYSHRLDDYGDDDDGDDDFNDYGRTVHRQWRQDASVSELSHDENDFDYNDDGYSTGDIMTMSGTI